MKVLFCVHALILIVFVSYGQTSNNLNPQLVDPLPPSPNASALAKFGSIPIGPSTGIPQINIPIYQFSNKNSGLSLSVSLDYHAGGIRVDEVASNVGLGWALNAGGNISRVVKSVPDECADGFLNNPYFDGETGNDPITDPSFKPFVKANNHQLDIEADIFSFNFNGRTGRFTYGRDGSILMIDDQKLKIQKEVPPVTAPAELMITKFVITDESGTKYTFDAVEKTYLPSASFHKTYASSWYLTKILSPSGKDSILFQYDDVDILDYATSFSETIAQDLNPNSSQTNNGILTSASTQFQRLYAKRLKNIKLPDGINLQFVYNSALRTDLPNDNLLSKIVIQDDSKQMARGFILQQDYSLNQRATLLKVIPYSGFTTIVQEQPYQFFYNPGLPPRISNRQDHWGYPTSRVLSESDANRRVPYEIFSEPIGGRYEMPGINRDTDSSACAAGTLNKIIYPTGGRTEFELEPNQAYNGWLDKSFSVVVDDPLYQNQIQSYNFSMTNGTPIQQDNYFVFNGEPDGTTEFTLSITPTTSRPWGAGTCMIRAEVFPTTGNTQAALSSVDFSDAFTQSTKTFSIVNLVKSAQYKIRFYFTFSGASEYYGYAQLQWKEKQAATQHTVNYSHLQPYVGGLRVRRILDYDKLSTDPVSIREYKYLNENGQSSGILAAYPTYTYTTRYVGASNVNISGGSAYYDGLYPGPANVILRQSSSAHDIVYTNGSPVTYSRIVEHIKSKNGENGRIERLFTTNYPASGGSFPFVPQTNLTWIYGLLKAELVYDNNDNLIEKTENEYAIKVYPNYGSIDSIKNFTSYSIAPVMFNIPTEWNEVPTSVNVSTYPPIWFLYNDYLPLAGRSDLIKSTTTSYDQQTHQSISKTVSNEYDPQYFYLKKKTLLTSKNQQSTEIYTYPADKVAAGQTEPYQQMVNQNIINPIIETEQQLDNVRLKKLITDYQRNWPNNAVSILPVTVQSQYRNDQPEVRIRYYSYDNKGNPLSAGQENGTKICYVWAYNKQYLIAEVKNADYSTVEAVLGGSSAVNTFCNQASPTDAAINNFLSPLRTDIRLKNALVTTCTYEPINGITLQTDPSGKTLHYEYDGFGRLKLIRDQNNNILKQFDYKYQAAP